MNELYSIRKALGSVNCTCPICHENTLQLGNGGRSFYCHSCKNKFNAWIYLLTGKIKHGCARFEISKILFFEYINNKIPLRFKKWMRIKK
jgi:hypothetical protein